jgi:serine protease AprX
MGTLELELRVLRRRRRRRRLDQVELEPLVVVDAVELLRGAAIMRSLLGVAVCITATLLAAPGPADAAAPRPRSTQVIVQFEPGSRPADRRAAVRAAGGVTIRDLHVIRALGVRLPADGAPRLAGMRGVRAVTPNAPMRSAAAGTTGRWSAWDPATVATAFLQSTRTDKVWTDPTWRSTGKGVTAAVIDTGIAGDLEDFRTSQSDPTSRVIASVVTNPDATTAADRYGHGTHVAGLLAGNGRALATSDPAFNRYLGSAPDAKLVSIKASDDHGNATVMDAIAGLQFVVDHGPDYGIRVVNLSMGSTLPLSYRIDPLDAAVEAAWAHGVVVVAAAGNRGAEPDAVSYAPANDPYIITVGAVDDHRTKDTSDDSLTPWSGRGVTQDGFAKPDLVAPGAHIVGPLAPGSDYPTLCAACVVDGRYFRVGGTSMAAPIVAGIAADVLSAHPDWTPDQVKGALTYNSGRLDADDEPIANMRLTADGAWEVAADSAVKASKRELQANQGLTPSSLLDPRTGDIDDTRASWGRASWKTAADSLRASWGAASWTCECSESDASADTARASWGHASWQSFFGESPSANGELAGGRSGGVPQDEDPQEA